ncbi:MAG: hypothetical protein HUU46_16295 [Candidatus Hydrogenedentes bacterium]|nr:hypothetical protein [Candidatus Hydrogenedentota bacterium]
MGRLRRVSIVVAIVALTFVIVAATLDFQLARAATSSRTNFAEASVARGGALHVLSGDRIYLHAENREGLGGNLVWEMRRQLQDVCGVTVTLLNNKPGPEDFPLVMTAVRDDAAFWTPFYASGSAKVFAKFASNTSHITVDTGAAVFDEDNGGSKVIPLVVSLNATVENSTFGLVSLPAFRKLMLRDAARGFAEYLKKAIEKAEAGGA